MISQPSIRQREIPGQGHDLPDSLHPVIKRILLTRGIHRHSSLQLGLRQLLTPKGMTGISQAAQILMQAIQQNQRILIVGDFDADGATGTAVAVKALRAMGAVHVDFLVPNRFDFGYGLSTALVETFAEQPPDVLVTVDSGISSLDGVVRARELDCQVIITDHHLPGPDLPDAHAIVNPNCPGNDFSSTSIAGVGVVFYLMTVLRTLLREEGWFEGRKEPNMAQLLDLVALGTVADLVPLDYNNRILVRQGIERIRKAQACPGLMALLKAGGRDYRQLVASDLGFTIAPRLNAAGRLEDMSLGIQCLLCDDPDQAYVMAKTLDELNQQRKDIQAQMQSDALGHVQDLVQNLRGESLPHGLCLYDQSWHQGVVGLVASKVKDAIHRPVIAFAPEAEGSSLLKGSARSIRGVHIRDVLAYIDAQHPRIIKAFGGHAMAAGLSLDFDQFDTFHELFTQAVDQFTEAGHFESVIETDGELTPDCLNLGFARLLRDSGPWGQQYPEPLFDGYFEVIDQRIVGDKHLKMIVQSREGGQEIDAIAFNCLPEDLSANSRYQRLLYRLDVNSFRGRQSAQLIVEHIADT